MAIRLTARQAKIGLFAVAGLTVAFLFYVGLANKCNMGGNLKVRQLLDFAFLQVS